MKILKKLFSSLPILFFIITLFVFLYILYKSIFNNNFSYYFSYLLIALVFSVLFFINIFTSKEFKNYISIITISLIVSLYSFQGYLTYKNLNKNDIEKKILEFEKKNNIIFDRRSKLEIFTDLSKNEKITVSITPYNLRNDKLLSFLPLSGISNSKTILCNELGYYSIINTDQYGFNNPINEWDKKNVYAMLVGDSFVHGSCVNPPNDIGGVIRNNVSNSRAVLNLGQAGNAPLTQYATLREYLNNDRKVEKVVWFHYEANDLYHDFQEELDNKILQKYLTDENFTQNLMNRQNESDILLNQKLDQVLKKDKNRPDIEKKIFLINFIKLNELRYLITKKSKVNQSPKIQEFKTILELTKKLTKKYNSELYFVYLPSFSYYGSKTFKDLDYDRVKKIISKLDIPFIDINELVFKQEDDPKKLFALETWNHYTVDGYFKVGSVVYDQIN